MIVKMKKAKIVVLKEDYENVIKSLQKHEVIMIINNEEGISNPSLTINEGLHEKVEETIKLANKYHKKKGLFGDYQVVDFQEFEGISENTINEVNELEKLNNRINEINQLKKEINNEIESLKIWENLDTIPRDLISTKNTSMRIGTIPNRSLSKFKDSLVDEDFEYDILPAYKGINGVILICYKDDEIKLNDLLTKFEFNDYKLPNLDCLVSDEINNKMIKLDNLNNELNDINSQIQELVKKLDKFKVLSDQILTQNEINQIKNLDTLKTVIIEGWVRIDTLDILEKSVSDVTEYYDIEYTDPDVDEVVPTYTKNKKFVSQFETITDMFSKPNSKETDPNPVMSVWYWFLFGMMMGDAGYGLLMILFCLLLKKIMKPKGNTLKLLNVIMYSGVPTIFWGIMFGSYFGFNPQTDLGLNIWYWFNPMENPIMMLLVSVVIGALHLITGLVVKAIINIKEKNILEMLSKNLSWILILVGIGMYFLNSLVGIIMVALGGLLIILFAGHAKKSVLGKALGGVLGLYDITSYMGDLLSYSRIMALAMSSAAVAVVMNTLAKMVGGSFVGMIFAGLIFIVGHIFNLVLGLLSAYVHDSRLQYIEFFGKFYEGGGVDFKPLSIKTKYIKEIKE